LNKTGTPGAGDNLISSCMGLTLAKHFAGTDKLKHTRLMFVSFDAEEIGLRGSHAFFARHKEELHQVKTWHFNVDCPYVADEIKFLSSDINGIWPLSQRMGKKMCEISHRLGYKHARLTDIMFLGGGTDAAEAARNGIEATTLIGLPFAPKDCHGKNVVYHSRNDTIEAVEKGIVEGTMGIFIEFVREVDQETFPGQ
jgi:putative aminopeptidase FrvX